MLCFILGGKNNDCDAFFFLGKHDCDALKKEYMAKSKKKGVYGYPFGPLAV